MLTLGDVFVLAALLYPIWKQLRKINEHLYQRELDGV